MLEKLKEEIDSYIARDPAARSRLEVVLCYPGFHAILFHRLSSALWRGGLRLAGRFLSHVGRFLTGIEIHPGARIGQRLFIDHGSGVVIGETAEVGDDVTLYHGVTLGGTTWNKGKRHPTLQDGVIVGAGAQLLGPITVGRGARVGANAVVVDDVPAGVTMVGIPARVLMRRASPEEREFCAYGVPAGTPPDPVIRTIESLRAQVGELAARVEELERRGGAEEEDRGEEDRGKAASAARWSG